MVVLLTSGMHSDYRIEGARNIPDNKIKEFCQELKNAQVVYERTRQAYTKSTQARQMLDTIGIDEIDQLEYADQKVTEMKVRLDSTRDRLNRIVHHVTSYPTVQVVEVNLSDSVWGVGTFGKDY